VNSVRSYVTILPPVISHSFHITYGIILHNILGQTSSTYFPYIIVVALVSWQLINCLSNDKKNEFSNILDAHSNLFIIALTFSTLSLSLTIRYELVGSSYILNFFSDPSKYFYLKLFLIPAQHNRVVRIAVRCAVRSAVRITFWCDGFDLIIRRPTKYGCLYVLKTHCNHQFPQIDQ
jgi:hypothetical protein